MCTSLVLAIATVLAGDCFVGRTCYSVTNLPGLDPSWLARDVLRAFSPATARHHATNQAVNQASRH